jgi:acetyl-CoA C-acetyltransferase
MSEAWAIDACRTPRRVGKLGKGAFGPNRTPAIGATVFDDIGQENGLDTRIRTT